MYAQYFGLKQEPFSIAPDPRYLFMSERHREALAHLLYGVSGGGGFVLLSGEIGAGKTTVCRCFLEQIPKDCNVAYVFNPKLTVSELLKLVCDEFHVAVDASASTVKDYLDPLNAFLLAAHADGRNNVLIIDEAQSLSVDVLEQLRLLTNLETAERKLLQIILIGQPELRAMLARPELEQLAQRVIARYHLKALSESETVQYIRHRMAVAGLKGPLPFDREARKVVFRLSRGVPRRINLLCDRALLGAYATNRMRVDPPIIEKAAREVFERPRRPKERPRERAIGVGLGLVAGAALFGVVMAAVNGMREPARAEAVRAAAAGASAASAAAPSGSALTAAAAGASAPAQAAAASAPAATTAASTPAATEPAMLAAADLRGRFKVGDRDESDAWRELGAQWKLSLADREPCRAAEREQVRCFKSANGTLALIRQLGRPAILTLRDDSEQPVHALLTGISEKGATLRIGEVSETIALLSLARMWRGEFATMWRLPPSHAGGDASPPAEWLHAQLATLGGDSEPGAKQSGAAALRSKVSAFQVAQGLKPDGLAGPITLMQLNRATGIDEPRLAIER